MPTLRVDLFILVDVDEEQVNIEQVEQEITEIVKERLANGQSLFEDDVAFEISSIEEVC